jgi:leucine-rich repeat protein SHOC2
MEIWSHVNYCGWDGKVNDNVSEFISKFCGAILKIGPSISNLRNLTTLNIRNSFLDNVSDAIWNIPNLSDITFNHNLLIDFPFPTKVNTMLTFLNLSGNSIVELQSIENLKCLEHFDISNNKIENANSIKNLPNLTYLDLSNNICNEFIDIPKNIEILNLSFNRFSTINISGLKKLYNFNISDNQLVDFTLSDCCDLHSLYLSSNMLVSLPDDICFSKLVTLDVFSNQLISFPEKIGNLHSLVDLLAYSNEIESLPDSFGLLTNLCHLDLSKNKLSILPHTIGGLNKLKNFDLSFNNLIELSPSIGSMSSLECLDLSNNDLESIPKEMENLKNLNELKIFNCKLTLLDFNIPTLTFLDISNNQLDDIYNIGNFVNLNILHLQNNEIVEIPSSIGNLTNLEIFNIEGNRISDIPPEIGNLVKMIDINLSHNEISEIPPEFFNMLNVRMLYFSGNKISSIPSEIGKCSNLQLIHFAYNQLTTLPIEIGLLQHLEVVIVAENPIDNIPREIQHIFEAPNYEEDIYNDSQSVHVSSIQKSIKDSIMRIIEANSESNAEHILSLIQTDDILTQETKDDLVEYSNDTTLISELEVGFLDVLVAVWNRISINENATDIKNILNNEIAESKLMCFTGRVSRLVNCLCGYDSLVEVKISDNEQISSVITSIANRLQLQNNYTTTLHKTIAKQELQDLHYTDDIIEQWIHHIE